jgi:hypothetical protein
VTVLGVSNALGVIGNPNLMTLIRKPIPIAIKSEVLSHGMSKH